MVYSHGYKGLEIVVTYDNYNKGLLFLIYKVLLSKIL